MSGSFASASGIYTEIRTLSQLGFRFNPFEHLDSGADRHLLEYLIDNQAFALAREEFPALVVAPPGAGKTAVRIAVSNTCLMGHSGRQTFPIIYNLPDYFVQPESCISYEEHVRGLLQAGASNILLYYSFRPEQYMALHRTDREAIAGLLQAHLPLGLPVYLEVLSQTHNPNTLIPQLETAYPQSYPPTPHLIDIFCLAMDDASGDVWSTPLQEQFNRMRELLFHALGARNIFVLVDGVDAIPQAGKDREAQFLGLVENLCAQVETFAHLGIYIKVFTPIDIPFKQINAFRIIHITWKREQIADLLRKRVFAATEGKLGSLDAFAEVGLQGIEDQLAQEIGPLPREAVYLAGRIFFDLAVKAETSAAVISSTDVAAAMLWLREKQAFSK